MGIRRFTRFFGKAGGDDFVLFERGFESLG